MYKKKIDRYQGEVGLTVDKWKLTPQLAPARVGMKRSPSLLGDLNGDIPGVEGLCEAGGLEERKIKVK